MEFMAQLSSICGLLCINMIYTTHVFVCTLMLNLVEKYHFKNNDHGVYLLNRFFT